jgi:arylsulfatase A-like enzyme
MVYISGMSGFVRTKRLIFLLTGYLGILCTGCGNGEPQRPEQTACLSEPLNVVMICLDTLRADRLGCYGYDLPTSPFLDGLSRQSILLTDVLAQNPSTVLSHRAVFTGNYVFRQESGPAPASHTIAGILTEAGYATAAFTDGGLMSVRFGNNPGFDVYNDAAGGTQRVFGRGLEWIDANPGKPFFLFLHTYDIHYPYMPPKPFDNMFLPPGDAPYHLGKDYGQEYWNGLDLERQEFIWISRRYDGGIRYTDTNMMDLWMALKNRNLLNNTIVIVFADHGESMGERLFVGHREPYEPQIHIPLLFHIPGWDHAVLDGAAESIDITPTLLELLSIKSDKPFCGRSLAVNMQKTIHLNLFRPRLSETWMRAFRLGPEWKLILQDKNENDALYHLPTDPEELRNLCGDYPEIAEELKHGLSQFTGIAYDNLHNQPVKPKVPVRLIAPDGDQDEDDVMKQLRELGYIQ